MTAMTSVTADGSVADGRQVKKRESDDRTGEKVCMLVIFWQPRAERGPEMRRNDASGLQKLQSGVAGNVDDENVQIRASSGSQRESLLLLILGTCSS
ncbi:MULTISPECIES: hypothetical protein [unclassified Cobetia]|uniref:hypothetical protein n=1 Tax=unclassified Cobetia TaxID=2609414 RepID=UPI002098253B|nr:MULTISPECIES: hypothetical protein [unclassified Cobetia]MCO7231001.1 hypothetical protein [Cobetia sp. Dlab-2-AX]MCO7234591.1 hypothetical protein [Cobetia sp. Dlab-2-U]